MTFVSKLFTTSFGGHKHDIAIVPNMLTLPFKSPDLSSRVLKTASSCWLQSASGSSVRSWRMACGHQIKAFPNIPKVFR